MYSPAHLTNGIDGHKGRGLMIGNAPDKTEIATAAKNLLGLEGLRPGQEEAIRVLLNGKDAVLVAPAGWGKSTVYKIAGGLKGGAMLIVTPHPRPEKGEAELKEKFIFVTPEQLQKDENVERLKAAGITLIVVEEAHCVSQWGHEYRPDYLEIARVIEALGQPTTLALTTAASNEARAEIIARLRLRDPQVLVRGFDRPNISLRVDTFDKDAEKLEAVMRRVEFADKPGVVFVATHHHAEQIAADLRDLGVDALAYHGGMKTKERDGIQSRFISGDVPVIVATNAFGMGVDKPDIRFVYHADVGESLDDYYEEIGLAGRDGEIAEAVLFYRARDISAQRYKTGAGKVEVSQIETVANVLVDRDSPKTAEHVSRETGISPRKLTNILHKFEEAGATRKLASGQIRVEPEQSAAEIAEAAFKQQQSQKDLRIHRLEQMQDYAETRSCRRENLLRYFGDDFVGPCGNCDRCEEATGVQARRA